MEHSSVRYALPVCMCVVSLCALPVCMGVVSLCAVGGCAKLLFPNSSWLDLG